MTQNGEQPVEGYELHFLRTTNEILIHALERGFIDKITAVCLALVAQELGTTQVEACTFARELTLAVTKKYPLSPELSNKLEQLVFLKQIKRELER